MIEQWRPSITASDRKAVGDVVSSGWIGPGKKVEEFEDMLCEYTGRKYAVCCNSGTTALFISLAVLPNTSTVYFPSYGMFAGANAARLLEKKVLLYDGPCTEVSAIMINLNGRLEAGYADARKFPTPVRQRIFIQDASQSMGEESGFNCGLVTTLSFSAQKFVTCGQGGAILTDNWDVTDACRAVVDQGGHGWRKSRVHEGIGGNFRMSDINAALGISQMKRLPEMIEQRNEIHNEYKKRIDADCGWSVIYEADDAEKLIGFLRERGIQSSSPYGNNARSLGLNPDDYPIAEKRSKTLVYLPGHLGLTQKCVHRVCDAIEEYEDA